MTSQMTPDVERNVSEINPEEMFLRFFNEASLVPVPPWQRLDDIQELLGDQAFKFARGLRGRLSRTPSQTQMFTVVCNCEQFLSTLIGTIFETSSNSRTLDETVNNIAIFLVPLGFILIWFFNSLKVLREYERGVIFRLGRLLPDPKGPGLIWVFWPIDRIVRVSLRTIVMDVPTQDVITSDNVSVKVNAVVYFRVVDPQKAIVEVENFVYATSQLAQTALRSMLGEVGLDDLLSQREKLNHRLQEILDLHTGPWGIKVALVEIKGVDLPEVMQRAMARQAEAEREKRAKVIHAQGEFEASEQLAAAAHTLSDQPIAIQLRYLQTLTEIGMEKNTTIVFPIPIDFLKYFVNREGPPSHDIAAAF